MKLRVPAISAIARKIFKKGSTTYYYSSLFFPAPIRHAVFTFYAYVRVADDYVDSIPQNIASFDAFCLMTADAFAGKKVKNQIVSEFYSMCQDYDVPYDWVTAFLKAMRADTKKKKYHTFVELEEYMYGSAEIIGLIMAKILKLPKEAYPSAQLQGKAMQLINFIRDIDEDTELGRTYLPAEDLKTFGVTKLPPSTAAETKAFQKLINYELDRYDAIQAEATKGYQFLPPAVLIPVKTAADIYNWTACTIRNNPMIIFEKKVKPRPARVFLQILKNYFTT